MGDCRQPAPSPSGRRLPSPAAAEDWFAALPPVAIPELFGVWRGEGLPSGHPLDGVLERFQWFGKAFHTADIVHPLLFRDGRGVPFAVEPRLLPFHLALRLGLAHSSIAAFAFGRLKRLFATRRPAARLRVMEWQGIVSATMIYNRLPIHDHFRRVSPTTVAGAMDDPGFDRPFFFLLHRSTDHVDPENLGGTLNAG